MGYLKKKLKDLLLAIFGMNFLKKVLNVLRNIRFGVMNTLNIWVVKIRIFNPIFSIIEKKLTQENFDSFLAYKNNFEKFVDSAGVKRKFFNSTENKIFFVQEFKKHALKIGRPDFIPALNEYLLEIDPASKEFRQEMIGTYRSLILDSFQNNKPFDFDYYISKLRSHDPVYSQYYILLHRKRSNSQVPQNDWVNLLDEAKKTNSDLVPLIQQQIS